MTHTPVAPPLGNSLQTRGNSGASWSTSPHGSLLVTHGSSNAAKKEDGKATRVIVIPGAR